MLFIGLHFAAVAAAAWLLIGGGTVRLETAFGIAWPLADLARRVLLLGCSAVYFARLCLTLFCFLRRKVTWSEALAIGIYTWIINITFSLLGGTQPAALGLLDAVAVGLYIAGSYLNTVSEYQRHRWKQRPENRGHLYTEGLFRWSMHINYFGDVVLFSGFALLTHRVLAFAIPLLMLLGFVFVNIPMLDSDLRTKYAGEFEQYERRTKHLVPWIY